MLEMLHLLVRILLILQIWTPFWLSRLPYGCCSRLWTGLRLRLLLRLIR